ncbi:MAG: DUF4397 domain-containing protein [Gemmatimonadota bacterium]|nr:DUF4397 domain-containing protein [Gemmatimonadota bacterium]
MHHIVRNFRNARVGSNRALATIGLVAGMAALAGCNLDNGLTATGGPQGLVQFINAAPRYRLVNLKIDSTTAVTSQGYGSGTSAYVSALTNARLLTVRDSANASTLASSSLLVADQSVYLAIFTQHATGGNLLIFPDTVSAPPGTTVGLRVINASPSAGNVDVYVTGADSTLTTPVATNVPFEGTSGYTYPANGGTLRLRITVAGTRTVLLDVDASALNPGQVRSIVLLDAAGGGLPAIYLPVPDRG